MAGIGSKKVDERRKKFAKYIAQGMAKYPAAIKAGYSENYAKSSSCKIMENVGVAKEVAKLNKHIECAEIMNVSEIQKRLTSIARGEDQEECIVIEGQGEGISQASLFKKKVTPKDQLKALELLGKANMLFIDRIIKTDEVPQIIDDL